MEAKCYKCEIKIPESIGNGAWLCTACYYDQEFIKCKGCKKKFHHSHYRSPSVDVLTDKINSFEIKKISGSLMSTCFFCYYCALNESIIIWNKYKKN